MLKDRFNKLKIRKAVINRSNSAQRNLIVSIGASLILLQKTENLNILLKIYVNALDCIHCLQSDIKIKLVP